MPERGVGDAPNVLLQVFRRPQPAVFSAAGRPKIVGGGRVPTGHVHSVSHVSDGHFVRWPAREERFKELPADFPMQAAYAIHRPAPPDGEIGHVEALRRVVRILAAQGQQVAGAYAQLPLGITIDVGFDEGRRKAVKARSYCGVRGKEIPRSRHRQRDFEGLPVFFHEISGALQHGERRMTFIQVTDFRLEAERAEQPPSADPEQQFLLEAQLRPASIELAGNSSMDGEVRRVIAVQQVKLHSTDLHLPCAQPDRITRQRDLQPQPLAVRLAHRRDRQLSGIVIRVKSLLRSVFIDHLAKIALLIEQPHAHHGHAQIAGGFELIAGHIAKPSRINRECFAQHEFHAEIRDAVQRSLRMPLLKPCRRLRRLMLGSQQVVNVLPEGRIGEHALDLIARDRLQHNPGILRMFP